MAIKLNVNEFKNGQTFLYEGDVYMVLESTHSKSGRGQAKVKVKCKNMIAGSTTSLTFTGGTIVDKAFVERKEMQYLYNDGINASMMNMETFDTTNILLENLKEEILFLVEGSQVLVTMYEGQILGVLLDKNVSLKVTEAPDAVAGNTVTNATKKITLETGLKIDAPQFIKTGDKIIVSTETKKYVSKG